MNHNSPVNYDLAIAGGGLAGLTLAIQAADAGYTVIVFEKETYPFHKVCGEYISMESWNFLERCGLPLADWNLPVIDHLKISDTTGKEYDFNLPLGGFGVSRYRLDNALYEIALKKGVRVLSGAKVNSVKYINDIFEIAANEQLFTARVCTGCFGKRSNLDVKWKRNFIGAKTSRVNNLVGIKYHIHYPQQRDTISLHNFSNGYCGISHIEDDTCCLCYLTTAANLQQSGNSIPEMERKILSKNKQLEKIFNKAEFVYPQPLTISQVSFRKKTQVEDHILMIGDAAGMITPLCGNGMSMAMHGGKIAFDNIRLYLSGNINQAELEKKYTMEWTQHFGLRTSIGRTVQGFFGGGASTSLFLQLMHAAPFFSKKLIERTHGSPF
jgi:flavin-dependent dehydrogenase